MANSIIPIKVDLREVAKERVVFSVQYKNILWFRLGMLFIRFGCFLTGASFVDEFPMSLYQEENHEE